MQILLKHSHQSAACVSPNLFAVEGHWIKNMSKYTCAQHDVRAGQQEVPESELLD